VAAGELSSNGNIASLARMTHSTRRYRTSTADSNRWLS